MERALGLIQIEMVCFVVSSAGWQLSKKCVYQLASDQYWQLRLICSRLRRCKTLPELPLNYQADYHSEPKKTHQAVG